MTADYDPPTDITVVQGSNISFTVSWTAPPTQAGYDRVTGYMIYYQTTEGGDVGIAHVGRDDTQHTVNGRLNGHTYSITMVTLSERLPSIVTDPVMIKLGECMNFPFGYCESILRMYYMLQACLIVIPVCRNTSLYLEQSPKPV